MQCASTLPQLMLCYQIGLDLQIPENSSLLQKVLSYLWLMFATTTSSKIYSEAWLCNRTLISSTTIAHQSSLMLQPPKALLLLFVWITTSASLMFSLRKTFHTILIVWYIKKVITTKLMKNLSAYFIVIQVHILY